MNRPKLKVKMCMGLDTSLIGSTVEPALLHLTIRSPFFCYYLLVNVAMPEVVPALCKRLSPSDNVVDIVISLLTFRLSRVTSLMTCFPAFSGFPG